MKSSKVLNRHSTQRHFQRHTANPKPTIYYLLYACLNNRHSIR